MVHKGGVSDKCGGDQELTGINKISPKSGLSGQNIKNMNSHSIYNICQNYHLSPVSL